MGVAHALAVALLGCYSGAASDTGGTERRRGRASKSQTGKNMNARFFAQGEHVAPLVRGPLGQATNGAPEFWFPRPVPPSQVRRL
jgi:hypothetical protein